MLKAGNNKMMTAAAEVKLSPAAQRAFALRAAEEELSDSDRHAVGFKLAQVWDQRRANDPDTLERDRAAEAAIPKSLREELAKAEAAADAAVKAREAARAAGIAAERRLLGESRAQEVEMFGGPRAAPKPNDGNPSKLQREMAAAQHAFDIATRNCEHLDSEMQRIRGIVRTRQWRARYLVQARQGQS